MKKSLQRVVIITFLFETLLAGGNGVAVRFSNRELAPLWGAGLRFALAAVLLTGIMLGLRKEFPRGKALLGAVVFGVLQFAGAFGFIYLALVQIHAGLGQTLLALVPLATLILAVSQGQEQLSSRAVWGALVGLAGIGVIYVDPGRVAVPISALMLSLASVICFAQALVVVRRIPDIHPIALNAVGMTVGAAVLLAVSVLRGESWSFPTLVVTWVALIYAVVLGSVVVFLLHVFLAQTWGASRAAYVMVTIPLVTITLSSWLDQEPVTLNFLLGGILIIMGVYIGALRKMPTPHSAPASSIR